MRTSEVTLEEYRRLIRNRWLPLTGRKRLSTSDYKLIQQWFNRRVPVELVLRAIDVSKSRSDSLYALGYITPTLEGLLRKRDQARVGEASEDWRSKWSFDLEELAQASDSEMAAMCRELKAALPKLSLEQAEGRWKEISNA